MRSTLLLVAPTPPRLPVRQKACSINPHAMENHGDLASHRNLGALHAAPLGNSQAFSWICRDCRPAQHCGWWYKLLKSQSGTRKGCGAPGWTTAGPQKPWGASRNSMLFRPAFHSQNQQQRDHRSQCAACRQSQQIQEKAQDYSGFGLKSQTLARKSAQLSRAPARAAGCRTRSLTARSKYKGRFVRICGDTVRTSKNIGSLPSKNLNINAPNDTLAFRSTYIYFLHAPFAQILWQSMGSAHQAAFVHLTCWYSRSPRRTLQFVQCFKHPLAKLP